MSLETASCCVPWATGSVRPRKRGKIALLARPIGSPRPRTPPRPQSSRNMEPYLSFRGRRALVTGAGKGDRGRRAGGGGRAGESLTLSPRRDRSRRGRGAEQSRGPRDRAEPNGGGLGDPHAGGTGSPLPAPLPRPNNPAPGPRAPSRPPAHGGRPRRSARASRPSAWTWRTGRLWRRRWARRGRSSCWLTTRRWRSCSRSWR